MRDKMVTLTFMVLTIMLSGAKAVPVEITQQPRVIRELPRQVAFSVHFRHFNVSVGHGWPMKFDMEGMNIAKGYDNKTGYFTAPTSGVYTFSLQIRSVPSDGSIVAGVITSDGTVCEARAESKDIDGFCTTNVHLRRGERVCAKQLKGSTYVYGKMSVMFSGSLICFDID